MIKKYNIAVIGATGIVGRTVIKILEENNFPVSNLYAIASSSSINKEIEFCGQLLSIESLESFAFHNIDISIFAVNNHIAAKYVPIAVANGCLVIDNSSHFRYDPEIPLVIPEINGKILNKKTTIIANPNCSTIQMLMALKPLHEVANIVRINIATYQSVSGAGNLGITELALQTNEILQKKSINPQVFDTQIGFNVLPRIDCFEDNGYTREEMKMVWETKKIFNNQNIKISATCVRVPVFIGHAEAINIETTKKITSYEVVKLLNNTKGVTVIDNRETNKYPTPAEIAHSNDVFVGRIREDIACNNGIVMWVVADNVRKGAALNSVQIAEFLIKEKIIS